MNVSLKASSIVLTGIIFVTSSIAHLQLASSQAQDTGKTKQVTLIADERQLQVAPDNAFHPGGIQYNAMVFNGTIPGPVIAIDQGDTLQITLKNEGKLVHSMTIQAGFGAAEANSGSVAPGESKTWTLRGIYAGAFLYYGAGDALNGIWEHIASGMYGGIIVHPTNEEPAKEFYVVFSEIYATNASSGSFSISKFIANTPDLVLTNGMAYKYVPAIGQIVKLQINKNAEVFKVKPGELTRWYIVNAGPRGYVAFNFIGGMINVHDGSVLDRYGTQDLNDETWTIPPGSASVIESTFPEPGLYVGMDHDMYRTLAGGFFAVLATENSTATDHPAGTWVPPKGSDIASALKP